MRNISTRRCVWCGEEYQVTVNSETMPRITCFDCKQPYRRSVKKAQEEAKKLGHCLCGLEKCECEVFKKTKICKCAIAHRKETR